MPSQVRTHPDDHMYISLLHIHRGARGLDENMSDTMAHVVRLAKFGEAAEKLAASGDLNSGFGTVHAMYLTMVEGKVLK